MEDRELIDMIREYMCVIQSENEAMRMHMETWKTDFMHELRRLLEEKNASALERENEELRKELERLRKENEELRKELERLRKENEVLRHEIGHYRDLIDRYEERYMDVTEKYERLLKELHKALQRIAELEEENRRLRSGM